MVPPSFGNPCRFAKAKFFFASRVRYKLIISTIYLIINSFSFGKPARIAKARPKARPNARPKARPKARLYITKGFERETYLCLNQQSIRSFSYPLNTVLTGNPWRKFS